MQQPALLAVDDAIFAAAVDAALALVTPAGAASNSYAQQLINVYPHGMVYNLNTEATTVVAQIAAIQAASDAWHIANP